MEDSLQAHYLRNLRESSKGTRNAPKLKGTSKRKKNKLDQKTDESKIFAKSKRPKIKETESGMSFSF